MGYYTMTGDISEDFSTIHYTGKWKKLNPIDIHLGWDSTVGVFIIKCWKLEKGNKATDWTPAPEDKADNSQSVNYALSSEQLETTTIVKDTPTLWQNIFSHTNFL